MAFPNTYMANPLETLIAADLLQQRERSTWWETIIKSIFPIQNYEKAIETYAPPFPIIFPTPGRGRIQ